MKILRGMRVVPEKPKRCADERTENTVSSPTFGCIECRGKCPAEVLLTYVSTVRRPQRCRTAMRETVQPVSEIDALRRTDTSQRQRKPETETNASGQKCGEWMNE